MTKKYQVTIAIQDYVTVVEAENYEEAQDLAWGEMTNHELYSPLSVAHAYIADTEYLVEENDND
jgi:hypothetical protein